jgi:hypothetical protein
MNSLKSSAEQSYITLQNEVESALPPDSINTESGFPYLRLEWINLKVRMDIDSRDEFELYMGFKEHPIHSRAILRREITRGWHQINQNLVRFNRASTNVRVMAVEDDRLPWNTAVWHNPIEIFANWVVAWLTNSPHSIDAPDFQSLNESNAGLAESRFRNSKIIDSPNITYFDTFSDGVTRGRESVNIALRTFIPGLFGGDDYYLGSGVKNLNRLRVRNYVNNFGNFDTRRSTNGFLLGAVDYIFTLQN